MMKNPKITKCRFSARHMFQTLVVWVLFCCTCSVHAEYRDLIEMPAIKVSTARLGLTLDIAQAGERLVTVGERGHILFSDDQGATWSQAEVDTRAHLNAVYFPDAKNGWAVGEDAVIVHSSDGGQTWSRQFDARNAEIKGPLLDLWFKDGKEGFAIGAYNKIYKTTDGGQTWIDWSGHVDNIDEWHLFSIAGGKDQQIYLASEQGLVFRSIDGGENFTPVETGHSGSFHGLLVKPGTDDNDVLLLSGVGGILYVSVDSAENWTTLDSGTETGLSGSCWQKDGSASIVGYGGMLLNIDPNLQTVHRYPQKNGLPLSGVNALADGSLVLVGFGGPQVIAPQQTN